MNRLKIGFAAFMAIFAMSFTFVSKTNSVNTGFAKVSVLDGCYQTVKISDLYYTITYTEWNGTPYWGYQVIFTSSILFQPIALRWQSVNETQGSIIIDIITNAPYVIQVLNSAAIG